MKNENLRAAIWVVALVLLSLWMALGWLRFPPSDRLGVPATPFQRTPGLDEGYWRFLQQANDVLPPSSVYTIRAATADDEMMLFMLAGSVLAGHRGEPSSYYGVPNAGGAMTRWVLSYRCAVVPPDASVVASLPDGCICERRQ
jgi:hypothetical protein